MVQAQLEHVTKPQQDLLVALPKEHNYQAYGVGIRAGVFTQDPLYPDGHPKRIGQDSQIVNDDAFVLVKICFSVLKFCFTWS